MNGKTLIVLIIGLITGAAIFATAFYFGKQTKVVTGSITPTPLAFDLPATTTLTPTTIAQIEAVKGTIEGSLSYPSEGIPPELTVCAETLEGIEVACTGTHIKNSKFTSGVGYNLELPTGKYYVYATVPLQSRAYYTEFVTCGLKYGCPSHQKIEVQVIEGETTSNIDPGDWYNPNN